MKQIKNVYLPPVVDVMTVVVEQGFAISDEKDNNNGGTTAPEWGII